MNRRLMTGLLAAGLMVGLTAPAALGADATKEEGLFDSGAGTATLVRNDSGVSLNAIVTGLVPGQVYSAWWFVNDDFDSNAAGGIANAAGRVTFSGRIGEDGWDARTAVIGIAILNHGTKIQGSQHQQMTDTAFGDEATSNCDGTDASCVPPVAFITFDPS